MTNNYVEFLLSSSREMVTFERTRAVDHSSKKKIASHVRIARRVEFSKQEQEFDAG